MMRSVSRLWIVSIAVLLGGGMRAAHAQELRDRETAPVARANVYEKSITKLLADGPSAESLPPQLNAGTVAPGGRRPDQVGANLPAIERFVRKLLIAVGSASALCVALLLGIRWQGKGNVPDGGELKLISTLPLAPRCSVTLIQASGQSFLVTRDASGVRDIVPVQPRFDSLLRDDLAADPTLTNAVR